MSRIVFGSWMIRYPLGGNLSWALQYLLGLKALGHDVYFVERSNYINACYNPVKNEMSDDSSYGLGIVSELLSRFGLQNKWCYTDNAGNYFGLSKKEIEAVFKTADLFIDSGSHGSWAEESMYAGGRVLIEGEPAYTQMKWAKNLEAGIAVPAYDWYYSNGKNIGAEGNAVPTMGIAWRSIYSPVNTSLFEAREPATGASYSTIMNWKAHAPIEYKGNVYGQKDQEFQKFISLPALVNVPISVAVSGKHVPEEMLKTNGWKIQKGERITLSFESFCDYLSASRGEFSICKNVFVANNTGWFSDKSAAYLASGRPVVLQDTGFSKHLPVGEGLFAVNNVEEAREAIKMIESDYKLHSRRSREIACEYLEAEKLMGNFLNEIGL
jgi:hypothetical protein